MAWKTSFRQNYQTFLAHSSTFRRWVLSRGDTRGDAWQRNLEPLTKIAQKALRLRCVVVQTKTVGLEKAMQNILLVKTFFKLNQNSLLSRNDRKELRYFILWHNIRIFFIFCVESTF
jgi:hypothetical protein